MYGGVGREKFHSLRLYCIVDKWDLLTFPIVPGLHWRAGDRTLI